MGCTSASLPNMCWIHVGYIKGICSSSFKNSYIKIKVVHTHSNLECTRGCVVSDLILTSQSCICIS